MPRFFQSLNLIRPRTRVPSEVRLSADGEWIEWRGQTEAPSPENALKLFQRVAAGDHAALVAFVKQSGPLPLCRHGALIAEGGSLACGCTAPDLPALGSGGVKGPLAFPPGALPDVQVLPFLRNEWKREPVAGYLRYARGFRAAATVGSLLNGAELDVRSKKMARRRPEGPNFDPRIAAVMEIIQQEATSIDEAFEVDLGYCDPPQAGLAEIVGVLLDNAGAQAGLVWTGNRFTWELVPATRDFPGWFHSSLATLAMGLADVLTGDSYRCSVCGVVFTVPVDDEGNQRRLRRGRSVYCGPECRERGRRKWDRDRWQAKGSDARREKKAKARVLESGAD